MPSYQGLLTAAETGALVEYMILGRAWGEHAPVKTFNHMFYADVELAPGARVPLPDDHEDRGLDAVSGSIVIGGQSFEAAQMMTFRAGVPAARDGGAGGGAADTARGRDAGRAAVHMVELRGLVAGADRSGQGSLASGRLGARALPLAAGG